MSTISNHEDQSAARDLIAKIRREVVQRGEMTNHEEAHLVALDQCLAMIGDGAFVPGDQCPECATNGLTRDEVDVGVGVMCGPASCMFCGFTEEGTA